MVFAVPPRPGAEGGREWMRSMREEVKAIRRDVGTRPSFGQQIPPAVMTSVHNMPPQGSTIVSPNITFIDSPRGSHSHLATQKAASQAEKQQQHSHLISRISELEKLVKSVADTVKREELYDDVPIPPFESALQEAVKSLERERRDAISAGDVGLTNKIEANIAALKQSTQRPGGWEPQTPSFEETLPPPSYQKHQPHQPHPLQHQHQQQIAPLPTNHRPGGYPLSERGLPGGGGGGGPLPQHSDIVQISPPRTRTAPTAEMFIAAEGGEVFSTSGAHVTATGGILPPAVSNRTFGPNGYIDTSQEVLTVTAAQRLLDSVEQVALRKGVTLTTTTTTLTASPQQTGSHQAMHAHDSRQVLTPSKDGGGGAPTVVTTNDGTQAPHPVIALGGHTTINIADSTTASSSEMYETGSGSEEEDIRTSTHRSEKSRERGSLNKVASRQSIRSSRSLASKAGQSKSSAPGGGGMDQTFAQVQKQLAAAAKAKAKRKSRG